MRPSHRALPAAAMLLVCACSQQPAGQVAVSDPQAGILLRAKRAPVRPAHYRFAFRVHGGGDWDVSARVLVEPVEEPPASPARGGADVRHRVGLKVEDLVVHRNGVDLPTGLRGVQLFDVRDARLARLGAPRVQLAEPPQGAGVAAKPPRNPRALARQLAALFDLVHQLEYPEGPVTLADGWTPAPHTLVVPGLGAIRVRPAYVLRGLTGQGAARRAQIDAEIQLSAGTQRPFRTLRLSGTGSGYARFEVDVSTGAVARTSTRFSFMHQLSDERGTIIAQREIFLRARGGPAFATQPAAQIVLPGFPSEPPASPECDAAIDRLPVAGHGLPPVAPSDLLGTLGAVSLPLATGEPFSVPGSVLILPATGERALLSGGEVAPARLPAALAQSLKPQDRLYFLVDRRVELQTLGRWLARAPSDRSLWLVTRDPSAAQLTGPAWQRAAVATAERGATLARRTSALKQMLYAQLSLCPAARDAVRTAFANRRLPGQDLSDGVRRCGCRLVHIPGLSATLTAMFGGADLRVQPLPRNLWGKTGTLDIALSGGSHRDPDWSGH